MTYLEGLSDYCQGPQLALKENEINSILIFNIDIILFQRF